MARAYSGDLRERVRLAYASGEGSQAVLAQRYRIGARTLSSWLKVALRAEPGAPTTRA